MHMTEDDNDAVIVQSIIDLGRNLDLQVVAEGIEDAATWQRLSEMGCDIAQGFYLGRPQPPVQLERWFTENGVLFDSDVKTRADDPSAVVSGRIASVTPLHATRRAG